MRRIPNGFILKSDKLCKQSEQKEEQTLRKALVKAGEEACDSMPRLCSELTCQSDHPITVQDVHEIKHSLLKRFDRFVKLAWDKVHRFLVLLVGLEVTGLMSFLISLARTARLESNGSAMLRKRRRKPSYETNCKYLPKKGRNNIKKKAMLYSYGRLDSFL